MAWLALHWFDLVQTVGIVGGLAFTGYALQRDEQSRKIANLIAIKQQHQDIWREFYDQPALARVLEAKADVGNHPISDIERIFVNFVILHLATVYQAMKEGTFVTIEGLQADIHGFFSLPIPHAVWERTKPLQDRDFVRFVEAAVSRQ